MNLNCAIKIFAVKKLKHFGFNLNLISLMFIWFSDFSVLSLYWYSSKNQSYKKDQIQNSIPLVLTFLFENPTLSLLVESFIQILFIYFCFVYKCLKAFTSHQPYEIEEIFHISFATDIYRCCRRLTIR